MSVAFQTVSTAGWEGKAETETLTITKPSGVVSGDLMVAHIASSSNVSASNITWDAPSGWTSLGTASADSDDGEAQMNVYYKVAGGSEGASYAWTATNATRWAHGAIYRIDGQGDVSSIQIALNGQTGGTETYTTTVTPVFPDSLLLFLVNAEDNAAAGSVDTYAIATSNPTWTERYDVYGSSDAFFGAGDGDGVAAGATASRPEKTATGNASCVIASFAINSVCAIVVIPPLTNVTVSPAVLEITASIPASTVTGTATVSPSVIEMTASVPAPTVTTAAAKWSNQAKSSAPSWSNLSKS